MIGRRGKLEIHQQRLQHRGGLVWRHVRCHSRASGYQRATACLVVAFSESMHGVAVQNQDGGRIDTLDGWQDFGRLTCYE